MRKIKVDFRRGIPWVEDGLTRQGKRYSSLWHRSGPLTIYSHSVDISNARLIYNTVVSFTNTPFTEMSMSLVEKPAAFSALQVYRPSSSFVISEKKRDKLCPYNVLFLSHVICGSGWPTTTLCIKFILFPSMMTLLPPEISTFGWTKR